MIIGFLYEVPKLNPFTVTCAPPRTDPELGLTEFTIGAIAKAALSINTNAVITKTIK